MLSALTLTSHYEEQIYMASSDSESHLRLSQIHKDSMPPELTCGQRSDDIRVFRARKAISKKVGIEFSFYTSYMTIRVLWKPFSITWISKKKKKNLVATVIFLMNSTRDLQIAKGIQALSSLSRVSHYLDQRELIKIGMDPANYWRYYSFPAGTVSIST